MKDLEAEEKWSEWTDRYAAEECDMRDRDVVVSLLKAYSIRFGECQVGVLMHQAAKMLELKGSNAL